MILTKRSSGIQIVSFRCAKWNGSSHIRWTNHEMCWVLETGVLRTGIGVLHLIFQWKDIYTVYIYMFCLSSSVHGEHGLIWCIPGLGFKAESIMVLLLHCLAGVVSRCCYLPQTPCYFFSHWTPWTPRPPRPTCCNFIREAEAFEVIFQLSNWKWLCHYFVQSIFPFLWKRNSLNWKAVVLILWQCFAMDSVHGNVGYYSILEMYIENICEPEKYF